MQAQTVGDRAGHGKERTACGGLVHDFVSRKKKEQPTLGGTAFLVTRTGLASICALRETAQIKVFVSVRTDSCTCHRHVRT